MAGEDQYLGYREGNGDTLHYVNSAHQPQPAHNVALGILIVVGIAGLAVGGVALSKGLKNPFTSHAINDISIGTIEGPDTQALKQSDTDGDGLSDYDELYTYKTSPYIKDTDSDGYDDKTEVASGHDPNCPADQNCFRDELSSDDQTIDTSFLNEITGGTATGQLPNLTPSQVRGLLIESGTSAEVLDQYTDDQIMEMYNTTLSSQMDQQNLQQQAFDPTEIDFENITPAQVRQMVRSTGAIPEEELEKLDDETLLNLYYEAMGIPRP